MLRQKVDLDLVWVEWIRADIVHLYEAGLGIGKDLTIALKTEAELAVAHIERCLKNCVEVDVERAVVGDLVYGGLKLFLLRLLDVKFD